MKRMIYHGSRNRIEVPVFGGGKNYNDYGSGFYCTEEADMAREWSVGRNEDGFVNQYEIDEEGLHFVNLNDGSYTMLHWLAMLLNNRTFDTNNGLAREGKEYILKHFLVPMDGVDVMVGYRADDSYFSFAQDFLNGAISYRQLANAMKLGNLGEQYVLISRKAFAQIHFQQAWETPAKLWFPKKQIRDRRARKQYFDIERNRRQKGDIYITHILDEEMKNDDPRL